MSFASSASVFPLSRRSLRTSAPSASARPASFFPLGLAIAPDYSLGRWGSLPVPARRAIARTCGIVPNRLTGLVRPVRHITFQATEEKRNDQDERERPA